MKFSIIIPVYNVEKYITKCLESIEKQTYKSYEVIIVNDGTKDNSQKIIDDFVSKHSENFKSYIKENGGLSDARNYGIEKAKGEYIVFLDADDYIDEKLLEEINAKIENDKDIDLIKVPINTISEDGKITNTEIIEEKILSGQELFIYLRKKRICIEPAWSYVVKVEYWKKNNFKFPVGKLHEDFATILILLIKAKKISIVSKTYYNYLIRENSIMTNKSYDNEVRKVKDKLYHYDELLKELENIENISQETKETFKEYISTAICMSLKRLNSKDKFIYKKELRKRKVINNFKCNSFRNTLRKIVFAIMIFI